MGLMTGLPKVIEEAKKEYDCIGGASSGISFTLAEELGISDNLLAMGDNAGFIKHLLDGGDDVGSLRGQIQQIYIDPPFFSKASYDAVIKLHRPEGETAVKHRAYEDVWKEGMSEYLKMNSSFPYARPAGR